MLEIVWLLYCGGLNEYIHFRTKKIIIEGTIGIIPINEMNQGPACNQYTPLGPFSPSPPSLSLPEI